MPSDGRSQIGGAHSRSRERLISNIDFSQRSAHFLSTHEADRLLPHTAGFYSQTHKYRDGDTLAFTCEAQEQMFGADIGMAELKRFAE